MRKGGRLVVVDPLRTKIAEQADLHVALLPGTDTLLAWSLAAELERAGAFDTAFIAAHVLGVGRIHGPGTRMARRAGGRGVRRAGGADPHAWRGWLAEADPLVLAPGNGLERGRNGGSGIRAAIALPALLGKLGNGSGIALGAGSAFPKTVARLQRPDLVPPDTRTLNLIDFGRHLDTGRPRSAAARGVHLQPQSDRGASGPEPHAARPGAGRRSSPSASR